MREKILRLLSNLAAFNKLDERVVDIISKVFKVDAKEICEKWGITYYISKKYNEEQSKGIEETINAIKKSE